MAPLLKEKKIPVILGSVLGLPSREDAHHAATYRAAGELAQAGVTFAFGTGSYQNVRLLPYEAAMSVAWGLDRDRALRAITIDAATSSASPTGRQPRAGQVGEPVRRQRRSARDADAVHASSSTGATSGSRASTPSSTSGIQSRPVKAGAR